MKPVKLLLEGDEIAEDLENHPENWVEATAEEQATFRRTLKQPKETRISLRINEDVLEKIKVKAQSEGLPYQTYISSILFKKAHDRDEFATLLGELVHDIETLKKAYKKEEERLEILENKVKSA